MLRDYRAARRGRRGAPAPRPGARRAGHRLLLRAAAARPDQDPRARRLLHRRRRLRAGPPLSAADVPLEGDPLDNLVDAFLSDAAPTPGPLRYIGRTTKGRELVATARRARAAPRAWSSAPPASATRRCSTSPCAVTRRGTRRHPVDRLQVRREHRPVPGHPRAGRAPSPTRSSSGARPDHADQTTRARPAAEKDRSQLRQKEMIADHFDRLAEAPEHAARRTSTPSCPATSPSCCAASTCCRCCPRSTPCSRACAASRKDYIAVAEKLGHSEDVCTYVKCDIGMMKSGNIGPTGRAPAQARPAPALLHRLLHLHEVVRAPARGVRRPVAMLHVPYQGRRPHHRRHAHVRRRPAARRRSSRRSSGSPAARYDEDRLRDAAGRSAAKAEDDLVWVLRVRARTRPRPIDAYFGGVYYIGPIFTAFRGTQDAVRLLPRAARGDRGAHRARARAR